MRNRESRRATLSGEMGTMDRAIEKTMAVIERVLAFAFVFAVGLNFVNVIDRYLLGHSMMGADEVQIYIMVYMTFLGAVVVTSRKAHLRMDVLVQYFPRWFQSRDQGGGVCPFHRTCLLRPGAVVSLYLADVHPRPQKRQHEHTHVDSPRRGGPGLRVDGADRPLAWDPVRARGKTR